MRAQIDSGVVVWDGSARPLTCEPQSHRCPLKQAKTEAKTAALTLTMGVCCSWLALQRLQMSGMEDFQTYGGREKDLQVISGTAVEQVGELCACSFCAAAAIIAAGRGRLTAAAAAAAAAPHARPRAQLPQASHNAAPVTPGLYSQQPQGMVHPPSSHS